MESAIFPEHCCVCMGPHETSVTITKSKHMGTGYLDFRIDVPVCNKCSKVGEKPAKITTLFAVPFCMIIGIWIGVHNSFMDVNWSYVIWGGVLGLIAGLLAGLAALMMYHVTPAQLRIGGRDGGGYVIEHIQFENKKYQELFDRANRGRWP